jgi:heptosyltransferase I
MPEGWRGDPPRSVLIVMLSALGDAVHVLPVVNALRRTWPDTRISWVIQPVPQRLVAGHPAVDEFIPFRRRRGTHAWRSYADIARAFQGRRFDLLLALQVYLKAGLITAQAPARVKLGFDRSRARDLNWMFTTHRIPARPTGHVQDQYFEFLEWLGIDPAPVIWGLGPTDEERVAQKSFFAALDRPACAIVVGTSKPLKNWSAEGYAGVVDAVTERFGMRPVIVGGPSTAEREMADRVRGLARHEPLIALGDDVRRLVWLLDGSALVVSPDTGPLHIARALDVPVVGLYGYTNPKRYGPYRRFGDLVVDGYARSPDESYEPSLKHRREGMKRVTVDAVLEKIDRAVELYARPAGRV